MEIFGWSPELWVVQMICNCFHESFYISIPAFWNAITFFIVCLFKWFAAIFYESFLHVLKLSAKSGKIPWVWSWTGWDSKETCKKVHYKERLWNPKKNEEQTPQGFLSFTLSFFSPELLHCYYIYFHCSYLCSYYNSSRTLCIKCWVSVFHPEF